MPSCFCQLLSCTGKTQKCILRLQELLKIWSYLARPQCSKYNICLAADTSGPGEDFECESCFVPWSLSSSQLPGAKALGSIKQHVQLLNTVTVSRFSWENTILCALLHGWGKDKLKICGLPFPSVCPFLLNPWSEQVTRVMCQMLCNCKQASAC